MKVLVLGGTYFIGRHIVEGLLKAGHTVSILNRGKTQDNFPSDVERFHCDRNNGMLALNLLKAREWDACVDVSGYFSKHVRASAEFLRDRVERYIFVSAVSVYGDPKHGPVFETHPRVHPAEEGITEINSNETYGALKVTCENIVHDIYGNRCTILRLQIVAGPHDPLDRFSYWVRRAKLGGEILAPGDGSDYLQFIDARDVAQFTRIVIEKNIGGNFNLAGRRLLWFEFMKIIGAQNIVWVSGEIIKSAGLTEFELPLFRQNGNPRSSLMNVSNELAVRAGLKLTDIEITIKSTSDWLRSTDINAALSSEVEGKLIHISRHARSL